METLDPRQQFDLGDHSLLDGIFRRVLEWNNAHAAMGRGRALGGGGGGVGGGVGGGMMIPGSVPFPQVPPGHFSQVTPPRAFPAGAFSQAPSASVPPTPHSSAAAGDSNHYARTSPASDRRAPGATKDSTPHSPASDTTHVKKRRDLILPDEEDDEFSSSSPRPSNSSSGCSGRTPEVRSRRDAGAAGKGGPPSGGMSAFSSKQASSDSMLSSMSSMSQSQDFGWREQFNQGWREAQQAGWREQANQGWGDPYVYPWRGADPGQQMWRDPPLYPTAAQPPAADGGGGGGGGGADAGGSGGGGGGGAAMMMMMMPPQAYHYHHSNNNNSHLASPMLSRGLSGESMTSFGMASPPPTSDSYVPPPYVPAQQVQNPAEMMLMNLGFGGSAEGFLPERFLRDWYNKISRMQGGHFPAGSSRPPDGGSALLSGSSASFHHHHHQPVDPRVSLQSKPSYEDLRSASDLHRRIGRPMNRSATMSTSQPNDPAAAAAVVAETPAASLPPSQGKDSASDRLKEYIEAYAQNMSNATDARSLRIRQFASSRQKSLPLYLETLTEEEEAKGRSTGYKPQDRESHLQAFLREDSTSAAAERGGDARESAACSGTASNEQSLCGSESDSLSGSDSCNQRARRGLVFAPRDSPPRVSAAAASDSSSPTTSHHSPITSRTLTLKMPEAVGKPSSGSRKKDEADTRGVLPPRGGEERHGGRSSPAHSPEKRPGLRCGPQTYLLPGDAREAEERERDGVSYRPKSPTPRSTPANKEHRAKSPIKRAKSPSHGPKSPSHGPKSPSHGPKSPSHGPKSPSHGPKSPSLRPKSPRLNRAKSPGKGMSAKAADDGTVLRAKAPTSSFEDSSSSSSPSAMKPPRYVDSGSSGRMSTSLSSPESPVRRKRNLSSRRSPLRKSSADKDQSRYLHGQSGTFLTVISSHDARETEEGDAESDAAENRVSDSGQKYEKTEPLVSNESLEVADIFQNPGASSSREEGSPLVTKTMAGIGGRGQLEPAMISIVLEDVDGNLMEKLDGFEGVRRDSSGGHQPRLQHLGDSGQHADLLHIPTCSSATSLSPVPLSPVTVIEVSLDNQQDSIDTEEGTGSSRDPNDEGDTSGMDSDVVPHVVGDFLSEDTDPSEFPRLVELTAERGAPHARPLSDNDDDVRSDEGSCGCPTKKGETCDACVEADDGRASPVLLFGSALSPAMSSPSSSSSLSSSLSSALLAAFPLNVSDTGVQADDGRLSPLALLTEEAAPVFVQTRSVEDLYLVSDQGVQCDGGGDSLNGVRARKMPEPEEIPDIPMVEMAHRFTQTGRIVKYEMSSQTEQSLQFPSVEAENVASARGEPVTSLPRALQFPCGHRVQGLNYDPSLPRVYPPVSNLPLSSPRKEQLAGTATTPSFDSEFWDFLGMEMPARLRKPLTAPILRQEPSQPQSTLSSCDFRVAQSVVPDPNQLRTPSFPARLSGSPGVGSVYSLSPGSYEAMPAGTRRDLASSSSSLESPVFSGPSRLTGFRSPIAPATSAEDSTPTSPATFAEDSTPTRPTPVDGPVHSLVKQLTSLPTASGVGHAAQNDSAQSSGATKHKAVNTSVTIATDFAGETGAGGRVEESRCFFVRPLLLDPAVVDLHVGERRDAAQVHVSLLSFNVSDYRGVENDKRRDAVSLRQSGGNCTDLSAQDTASSSPSEARRERTSHTVPPQQRAPSRQSPEKESAGAACVPQGKDRIQRTLTSEPVKQHTAPANSQSKPLAASVDGHHNHDVTRGGNRAGAGLPTSPSPDAFNGGHASVNGAGKMGPRFGSEDGSSTRKYSDGDFSRMEEARKLVLSQFLLRGSAESPSEELDSPAPAVVDAKDSPVPAVVDAKDSPVPAVVDAKDSPVPAVVDAKDSPVPAVADAKDSPVPAVVDAKDSPVPAVVDAKDSPVPAVVDAKDSPVHASADAKDSGRHRRNCLQHERQIDMTHDNEAEFSGYSSAKAKVLEMFKLGGASSTTTQNSESPGNLHVPPANDDEAAKETEVVESEVRGTKDSDRDRKTKVVESEVRGTNDSKGGRQTLKRRTFIGIDALQNLTFDCFLLRDNFDRAPSSVPTTEDENKTPDQNATVTNDKEASCEAKRVPHRTETVPHRTESVPHRKQSAPHRAQSVPHTTEIVPHGTESFPCGTKSFAHETESDQYRAGSVPHVTESVPHRTESDPVTTEIVPHRAKNVPSQTESVPSKNESVPDEDAAVSLSAGKEPSMTSPSVTSPSMTSPRMTPKDKPGARKGWLLETFAHSLVEAVCRDLQREYLENQMRQQARLRNDLKLPGVLATEDRPEKEPVKHTEARTCIRTVSGTVPVDSTSDNTDKDAETTAGDSSGSENNGTRFKRIATNTVVPSSVLDSDEAPFEVDQETEDSTSDVSAELSAIFAGCLPIACGGASCGGERSETIDSDDQSREEAKAPGDPPSWTFLGPEEQAPVPSDFNFRAAFHSPFKMVMNDGAGAYSDRSLSADSLSSLRANCSGSVEDILQAVNADGETDPPRHDLSDHDDVVLESPASAEVPTGSQEETVSGEDWKTDSAEGGLGASGQSTSNTDRGNGKIHSAEGNRQDTKGNDSVGGESQQAASSTSRSRTLSRGRKTSGCSNDVISPNASDSEGSLSGPLADDKMMQLTDDKVTQLADDKMTQLDDVKLTQPSLLAASHPPLQHLKEQEVLQDSFGSSPSFTTPESELDSDTDDHEGGDSPAKSPRTTDRQESEPHARFLPDSDALQNLFQGRLQNVLDGRGIGGYLSNISEEDGSLDKNSEPAAGELQVGRASRDPGTHSVLDTDLQFTGSQNGGKPTADLVSEELDFGIEVSLQPLPSNFHPGEVVITSPGNPNILTEPPDGNGGSHFETVFSLDVSVDEMTEELSQVRPAFATELDVPGDASPSETYLRVENRGLHSPVLFTRSNSIETPSSPGPSAGGSRKGTDQGLLDSPMKLSHLDGSVASTHSPDRSQHATAVTPSALLSSSPERNGGSLSDDRVTVTKNLFRSELRLSLHPVQGESGESPKLLSAAERREAYNWVAADRSGVGLSSSFSEENLSSPPLQPRRYQRSLSKDSNSSELSPKIVKRTVLSKDSNSSDLNPKIVKRTVPAKGSPTFDGGPASFPNSLRVPLVGESLVSKNALLRRSRSPPEAGTLRLPRSQSPIPDSDASARIHSPIFGRSSPPSAAASPAGLLPVLGHSPSCDSITSPGDASPIPNVTISSAEESVDLVSLAASPEVSSGATSPVFDRAPLSGSPSPDSPMPDGALLSPSQSPTSPVFERALSSRSQSPASPMVDGVLLSPIQSTPSPVFERVLSSTRQSPTSPMMDGALLSPRHSPTSPLSNMVLLSQSQSPTSPLLDRVLSSRSQSPDSPKFDRVFLSQSQSPTSPTCDEVLLLSRGQSPASPTENNSESKEFTHSSESRFSARSYQDVSKEPSSSHSRRAGTSIAVTTESPGPSQPAEVVDSTGRRHSPTLAQFRALQTFEPVSSPGASPQIVTPSAARTASISSVDSAPLTKSLCRTFHSSNHPSELQPRGRLWSLGDQNYSSSTDSPVPSTPSLSRKHSSSAASDSSSSLVEVRPAFPVKIQSSTPLHSPKLQSSDVKTCATHVVEAYMPKTCSPEASGSTRNAGGGGGAVAVSEILSKTDVKVGNCSLEPLCTNTGLPPEPVCTNTGLPPEPVCTNTGLPQEPVCTNTGLPQEPVCTNTGLPQEPVCTNTGLPQEPVCINTGLPPTASAVSDTDAEGSAPLPRSDPLTMLHLRRSRFQKPESTFSVQQNSSSSEQSSSETGASPSPQRRSFWSSGQRTVVSVATDSDSPKKHRPFRPWRGGDHESGQTRTPDGLIQRGLAPSPTAKHWVSAAVLRGVRESSSSTSDQISSDVSPGRSLASDGGSSDGRKPASGARVQKEARSLLGPVVPKSEAAFVNGLRIETTGRSVRELARQFEGRGTK